MTLDRPALLAQLRAYTPSPTPYFEHCAERIAHSLTWVPNGKGRVLELGCDSHFTLAMSLLHSYEMVPQNSPSPIAAPEDVTDPVVRFTHQTGAVTSFRRDIFDIEADPYPYEDGSFSGVLCCEVLEHLFHDPAFLLHEANRVLADGGWFMLTTPNITSYHHLRKLAQGVHPLEHSAYFHGKWGRLPIQHTREYGFWETVTLLRACGFTLERMATYTFGTSERLGWREWLTLLPATTLYNILKARHPRHLWPAYRRPHTFILARKSGPPMERYPTPVYLT